MSLQVQAESEQSDGGGESLWWNWFCLSLLRQLVRCRRQFVIPWSSVLRHLHGTLFCHLAYSVMWPHYDSCLSVRPSVTHFLSTFSLVFLLARPARLSFYAQEHLLLSARFSHCNSVSPSVCPSDTRMDQTKTAQARIIKFSPSSAWETLVSGTVKLFHKFVRGHSDQGG